MDLLQGLYDDEDDIEPPAPCTVIVCQGPPRCELEGESALAAQKAGCPWCDRQVFLDGTWHLSSPSEC